MAKEKSFIYKGIRKLKRIGRRLLPNALKYYYEEAQFILDNTSILGALDGEYAYGGPNLVQIDLTNDCDNSCIGCWCHSPLLGELKLDAEARKEKISFKVLKGLISELHKLGTSRINLSGGGEPFMYPKIMELLELLREKNIDTTIITSFSLINEQTVKRLIELDICELFVSLWAATPETYVATHPNKNINTFNRIQELLKIFSNSRQSRLRPRLKLINVICNRNYFEVEKMIDFALEVGADSIEFIPIDVIADKTDSLLLSTQEKQALLRILENIKKRTVFDMYFDKQGHYIRLEGNINLWERFRERIESSDAENGVYDKKLVDLFPCYAGWIYSRIMVNGDVIPCCTASRHPVGNIYQKSFREIWNSKEQREFRKKAKECKKSHPYFAKINCYKSCDNMIENIRFFQRFSSLTRYQLDLLEAELRNNRYLKRI